MQTLVIYYSRTGNTRLVAEMIAKELNADIEEIVDKTSREGVLGYLRAGRDAIRKKMTRIESIKKKPEKYDTIIIGQPVWGWTMVPALRTFLSKYDIGRKRVALFCTMGSSGDKKCFAETEKMIPNAEIIAKIGIRMPRERKMIPEIVKNFCKDIIKKMETKRQKK
ncbi:MAG: flavodoxin [Candidatus Woesearchaeota archaeon]